MKYLFIALLVVLTAGCATKGRYGDFAKIDAQTMDVITADAEKQIKKDFAPARYFFDLPKKAGRFGQSLEKLLRRDGYAMGDGGSIIYYAIDEIGKDKIRLLITVEKNHYSRAYHFIGNEFVPVGAWSVWENGAK